MADYPKYIVWKDTNDIEEAAIIPFHENHRPAPVGCEVVGAGWFELWTEEERVKVTCFGRSTSLDVKSRGPEDAAVIKRLLRIRGE